MYSVVLALPHYGGEVGRTTVSRSGNTQFSLSAKLNRYAREVSARTLPKPSRSTLPLCGSETSARPSLTARRRSPRSRPPPPLTQRRKKTRVEKNGYAALAFFPPFALLRLLSFPLSRVFRSSVTTVHRRPKFNTALSEIPAVPPLAVLFAPLLRSWGLSPSPLRSTAQ